MEKIVWAKEEDVSQILWFVRQLAVYEKLAHEVTATEESLRRHLFGERPAAEVIFLESEGRKVGFALFFTNFSTFLGKPGIYLEDLFVLPEARGRGYGQRLLAFLAALVVERDGGRLEWSVLDWNEPAIGFYKRLGAVAMAEWDVYRLTGDALLRLAQKS